MSRSSQLLAVALLSALAGVAFGVLLAQALRPAGELGRPALSAPVAEAGRTRTGEPEVAPVLDAWRGERHAAIPAIDPVARSGDRRPPPPEALGQDGGASTSRRDGDASIRGSVATLDGSPVEGVAFELEPPRGAPKYRPRRATSASDGTFEFAALPVGEWEIRASHPEYLVQRRNRHPLRVGPGAEILFLATPALHVDVDVVGPGAERARVAVRRKGAGEALWSDWSPESSTLALGPGAWELCALVDPLEDWPTWGGWRLAVAASPVWTVQVGTGDEAPVQLELESVNGLYGVVHLPDGNHSDVRPWLRLIEPIDGTSADFESPGQREQRQVRVDERGRYALFRLSSERWTAGVALGWSGPPKAFQVDVDGLTRLDLDWTPEDTAGSVVVDAFTPSGHRVTEGLRLRFFHRDTGDDPDGYLWQQAHVALEPGGSFRVVPLPLDADEARRAERKEQRWLRASLPGFAAIDRPINALEGQREEFRFAVSAELVVVLVGEGADRAMRRANCRLSGESGDSWAQYDETVGGLLFADLRPGDYELTLMAWSRWGDDRRQERLWNGRVDVRAGSQRIEVATPVRSDLVVRTLGVREGARAELAGCYAASTEDAADYASHMRADVDASGLVRFEGVLAGTYRLTIGSRAQIVQVPGPAVEFDGVLPERHFFRLSAGDSPVRRAGVRSGDVFVALDGRELAIGDFRRELQQLSTSSEGQATLTVERAGERFDIALDSALLGPEESFEAELEPDLAP